VLDAVYARGGETLYLRIGYFLTHRRDVRSQEAFFGSGQALSQTQEAPESPDMLVIGRGEAPAIIAGVPASIRYQRVASTAKGQRLVWFWYWVDGRMTGDLLLAKLLQVKAKILGGRQEVGIVALAVDYRGDVQDAENSLRDFASHAGPLGVAIAHARER
jgi:EpsI family protein